MGKSKASKQSTQDEEQLRSDVAAFASSLGFGSGPSSGFNDVDFRKTGSMKQQKPQKQSTQEEKPRENNSKKDKFSKKPHFDKAQKPKSGDNKPEQLPKTSKGGFNKTQMGKTAKPPALSLDNTRGGIGGGGGFDKYKNLPKLPLVKASVLGAWYEDAMELEKKVMGEEGGLKGRFELKMGVDAWKSMVEKKRELGERLMWQYAQDYQQSRGQDGDIKMLVTTQRSGTAADKVSAFSVLIGDNPIANLRSLDALLGMVTSKVGKRHALTGFEALKELFISSLLPDCKLRTLLQRPVNDLPETKDGYSLLLFWYWEDCLKQRYERFVFALEEASRDVLPILKDKALKITYALLKNKSEQERRLLSALVNKLGDPQSKGASNADYHLSNLLSDHPNMKAVVIDEVDSFLFRPHLALRAKYHAVNFLSQIRLSNRGDGPKVAKRLIDVYFALFKVLITEASSQKMGKSSKQDGKIASAPSKDGQMKNSSESHVELDSRLLSALLTGVNRAFPFVSSTEADDIIEVQTPVLFKLVHSKNFNVGVQALMLLDKISSKNHVVSDRFYRALYSKLLLPAAMNSSKAEMFIGLILRAMKNDVNLKRVAAFAKRLLQVALQQPPQYACGCLFLLSEVLKARPPLWNMVQQNEAVDDELEHFEDIVEETDKVPELASQKEENDLELDKRGGEANTVNDSSEGEDEPLPSGSEDGFSDDAGELKIKDRSKKFQKMQQPSATNQKEKVSSSVPGGYDPRHREPSFSNADRASWWELAVLAVHAHPSVATMAGTLLSGTNIVYNGNPLNDLSLPAFLDKFMEKKPKQTTWHGGSQIEPAKKLDMSNHLIGPEILSLAEMDVPPEDLVFHKFYMNKMNSSKPKKKKKKKAAEEEAAEELFEVDDDERSGGDDESDNEEIENMLDSSNPSFESDGEYDYDDLDKVANEDDDELVGDISDAEMDISEGEDFGVIANGDQSGDNDDGDDLDIGDSDSEEQVDHGKFDKKRSKRKSSGKVGESPFASLEDYEHLLNEDEDSAVKENSTKDKKAKSGKSRKKRKSSK